jgi:hypothetical protein
MRIRSRAIAPDSYYDDYNMHELESSIKTDLYCRDWILLELLRLISEIIVLGYFGSMYLVNW